MKKAIFGSLEEMDYFTRESFNSLRTNLRFSGKDIRAVMLTSCMPNEGKSTTALGLARSIAADGMQVVLVDLDLRKSALVGKYHITQEGGGDLQGVSHYLSGQADLEDIVYETNVENLFAVFTGPMAPNPTELIGTALFHEMLASLRNQFDMVILDTPPLGTVIDAALVAPDCDGAILLIQSGHISRRFAQNVQRQLEATGCRLLGVVLNEVDTGGSGYGYGYYRKGYGYYKKGYGYYGGYYSSGTEQSSGGEERKKHRHEKQPRASRKNQGD